MFLDSILLGIGGPPAADGQQSPVGGLFLMVSMFLIFYFVMLRPTQAKQKKLEAVVKALKPKDRVIVNPGIFAEVVAVEELTLLVRLDVNTKIRILKSAVAGLQDQAAETETK